MQVKTKRLGVATYLTPDGPLIEENLASLDECVQAARAHAPANLVIDLHLVPFFDSSGLEYVLDLATSLQETGGSLRLAGASSICRDVLEITRLDQAISVFEDLESAGRSFL
ncbi:MAG: STAS domain-containing protein [Candidatus Eisenbacteria sp.]|nr:STAS domain-containing protein [Candidatus Eisenbacteria bacterium]